MFLISKVQWMVVEKASTLRSTTFILNAVQNFVNYISKVNSPLRVKFLTLRLSANLDAQYALIPQSPIWPATEEIIQIRPEFRFLNSGITIRIAFIVPRTFTFICCRTLSSPRFSTTSWRLRPAQVNRKSISPNFSAAWSRV